MSGMIDNSRGALKSRSSVFFERYALAETENVRLNGMVKVLVVSLLVLVITMVYVLSRPKAVYYIPGAPASGVAYPDKVPSESVGNFAVSWLMDWFNYTPETVEGVYARSMKLMSPELLSRVHSRSLEELEKIQRERISSVFVLESAPDITEESAGFKVTFQGRRGVVVGKETLSWEPAVIHMSLLRQPSTINNPYGLAVRDVVRE